MGEKVRGCESESRATKTKQQIIHHGRLSARTVQNDRVERRWQKYPFTVRSPRFKAGGCCGQTTDSAAICSLHTNPRGTPTGKASIQVTASLLLSPSINQNKQSCTLRGELLVSLFLSSITAQLPEKRVSESSWAA